MKNKFFFILFFVSLTALTSCHSTNKEAPAVFFEGYDSYQRKVVLPKEPMRVISLSPGITEMIFLIHAQDKLVGISDYCKEPPETKEIPKVGGLQQINIESILACKPDLVLIGSIISKSDVDKLETAGIRVFALKEEQALDGMYNIVKKLGLLLNHQDDADRQIVEMQTAMKIIKENVDTIAHKQSVYYVVGFGDAGDFTAPGHSYINDIISLAGGENVGASLSSWSISREFLFKADPDIIIVRKEDANNFKTTYPYSLLSAVKNNKVFPIESDCIDIVSPRNIQAVIYINSLLQNKI